MNAQRIVVWGLILASLTGCASRGTRPAPPPARIDPINEDLRQAAQRFIAGQLTGKQYLDFVATRTGKARPGDAGPTAEQDRMTRDLLDQVVLMFNPGCDDSPVPQTPEPLEWGRGQQTPAGTMGFNLAITEVTNQKPECELFYEIEFRVERQAPHAVRHLTVAFKAVEDLKPGDARRAVFGLPIGPSLPPARTALRDGLANYLDVKWRVRAVNGAQKASPWSALREQGPASKGVEG
jgi:hypothetical protein